MRPISRGAWLALWWLQIAGLVLSELEVLAAGHVPTEQLALVAVLNTGRLAIAWWIHDRAWPRRSGEQRGAER